MKRLLLKLVNAVKLIIIFGAGFVGLAAGGYLSVIIAIGAGKLWLMLLVPVFAVLGAVCSMKLAEWLLIKRAPRYHAPLPQTPDEWARWHENMREIDERKGREKKERRESINPTTGLPMVVKGPGGFDVSGTRWYGNPNNPYDRR